MKNIEQGIKNNEIITNYFVIHNSLFYVRYSKPAVLAD